MSQASPQDTNPRPRTFPTADASDAPLTPRTSQRKRDAHALQTLWGDFRKSSYSVRVGMLRGSSRNANANALREV